MAEAQKMMQDPKFQEQMKKVTETSGFKQHMQAQTDAMKDPKKMEEMEKQMKTRLTEGNEALEKAKEMRQKATEEAKKKAGEDGAEDETKPAAEDDKKEEAEKEEAAEDMPDIPNLSLN